MIWRGRRGRPIAGTQAAAIGLRRCAGHHESGRCIVSCQLRLGLRRGRLAKGGHQGGNVWRKVIRAGNGNPCPMVQGSPNHLSTQRPAQCTAPLQVAAAVLGPESLSQTRAPREEITMEEMQCVCTHAIGAIQQCSMLGQINVLGRKCVSMEIIHIGGA